MKKIFLVAALCLGATGCFNRNGVTSTAAPEPAAPMLIASATPTFRDVFQQGQPIAFDYRPVEGVTLDSAVLYVDGVRQSGTDVAAWTCALPMSARVGRYAYRIEAFSGKDHSTKVGEFTVLPAHAPIEYTCEVLDTYPHDRQAYTQGLFWHDGFLYESTGLKGQSSLRKVELTTGKAVRRIDLSPDYFGEGIALLDGKIYQLTWQDRQGFVYDFDSFQQIEKFGYGTEGWGLTADGTSLYKSDGSEKIEVLDPNTFKRVRTIEAYTDKGKVEHLNELEWIDGEIWANVYGADIIVRIDPATGAVVGIIGFPGLIKRIDRDATTDVFNGIAYDPAAKAIYVTGKNWNKLFRIRLIAE
ncbi:MAG: glutaminyl-peptide cyclotransferase [Rikenellaceae bacterium]|jgi:glutamine cyclotransferase|nr:glutaminyl-peptide cyclotransferase [Rikenellaceae bacterium]